MKRPGALTAQEMDAWRALQAADPSLANPHLTPDFAQIADQVFSGVRAALVWDGAELAGVWAFRKGPLGFCRPVGGALSDYHGLVARPDAALDIGRIAAACGVRVYGYDYLPADQARHGFPGEADGECAIIDLADGYDAWREGRMAATSQFKRMDQKRRALEKNSELRVVLDDPSDAAFETLCEWKRAQLRASGYFDIFTAPATLDLLGRIRARRDREFRGVLSTLTVDGKLAAAHFGMQAGAAFQAWFPGYDPEYSKHAVGKILMDELARGGETEGWREIYLGRKDQPYKAEFASRDMKMMRGLLRTPSFAGAAHRAAEWTRRTAEAAPLGPVSEAPGRAMRKAVRIADFGWTAA